MIAPGGGFAVRDNVETKLALGTFHRDVDFADRLRGLLNTRPSMPFPGTRRTGPSGREET